MHSCNSEAAQAAAFHLLQARGIISKTVAPAFPRKEAVTHNSDVSSAFIANRRRELQTYLQVWCQLNLGLHEPLVALGLMQ